MTVFIRNIFSSWVGYSVTVLVGFLLSPVVVSHLGNTGYGIWTLILSLSGYLGLLDLGTRSSVARFVARYMAVGDDTKVNSTVSTATAILVASSALALLSAVVLVLGYSSFFHVEETLRTPARIAMLCAAVTVAFTLPAASFTAVITSMDRYDVLTGVTIVASITRASLAVAVLRSGYGIVALAVVVLVVSFAELIALFRAARCLYPQLRLQVGLVNKAMVGELVSFGVYRFVWVVANQLIFYSDSLVIGMFLNAASITYFALAGSLINYARNVVSVAIDTLLPSASRLHSLNDMTGLRKLHIAGTRLSLLIGLPICAGLLFLGKQFLTLWMGPNYDLSAHLLAILTLAQFLSMPQYISSLVLVGMARHKVLAQLALAEGLVNISGSILLVGKAGLIGVAWATVVPHVIATGIVLPLYTLSVLNAKVGEYWWDGWARPAVCAAPGVVLCYGLSRVINHPSWGIFLCEVTAVAVTVAVPAYFICLTHTQRSAARAKWRYALARVSM